MNKPLLIALTFTALLGNAFAVEYQAVKDWVRLPDVNAKPTNQHGDVAVSSKGEVYVSTMDPDAGVQVFSADGKFLRNVPGAPNDFHGFVIRKDGGTEYIFGPRVDKHTIVKMTLEGKIVLEIPASAIPDQYKLVRQPNTKKNAKGEITKLPDEGKPYVRMTAMDVAPNGDLYVTDGYASDFVHRFDRNGKYLASFGGKKEPYNFRTLHKIAIDTRFEPARIIGVDRANGRVVHMALDGKFIGVIATDMLLPAAVAVQGDYAVIGELKGQVTVLDKAGQVVAKFATNTNPAEAGTNKPEPAVWRPGVVTAPHGVAFSANGDIFVSEYSLFGRVHRFNRK
jgi:DNA-binding beta-propeller fold protein YncE